MGVRYFQARDHEPHLDGAERGHLRQADLPSDVRQVSRCRRVKVDPVVDFGPRHDEGVSRLERVDGEEGDAGVIPPDEVAGKLAVDDAREDGGHSHIVAKGP